MEDVWCKELALAHFNTCDAMQKNAVVYECSIGECPVNPIFFHSSF